MNDPLTGPSISDWQSLMSLSRAIGAAPAHICNASDLRQKAKGHYIHQRPGTPEDWTALGLTARSTRLYRCSDEPQEVTKAPRCREWISESQERVLRSKLLPKIVKLRKEAEAQALKALHVECLILDQLAGMNRSGEGRKAWADFVEELTVDGDPRVL